MAQNRSGKRKRRKSPKPALKPFAFMPLPDCINRQSPTGHDRYHQGHMTGQIRGTIEALSPIYVGSGIIDLGQNVKLIKTAVRTGGKVVIPGSSLKGAIRSVVEAISKSCVCKVSKKIQYKVPKEFAECRRKKKVCVACRMFGAMGFQGNVAIQDAPQTYGKVGTMRVPELHEPRKAPLNPPKRKFYMHGKVALGKTPVEACEVGSKFCFVVQVDNLTQAEWGLLLTALGHHPQHPFKLKIGGAKPLCFGSIDFQIKQIQVEGQARERYLDWDVQQESAKTGEQLETWKQKCIDQATNSLIQQDLLTKLAQILQYPNDRNCPSGPY